MSDEVVDEVVAEVTEEVAADAPQIAHDDYLELVWATNVPRRHPVCSESRCSRGGKHYLAR